MDYKEQLIDAVIEQIRQDLKVNDTSAIYELLGREVSEKSLEYFLPEEQAVALKQQNQQTRDFG